MSSGEHAGATFVFLKTTFVVRFYVTNSILKDINLKVSKFQAESAVLIHLFKSFGYTRRCDVIKPEILYYFCTILY